MLQYVVRWSQSGSKGVASSPQGSTLSTGLREGEVRGQSFLAGLRWGCGYRCCGGGEEQLAWGMQKSTRRAGKKWFLVVRSAAPDVKVQRPGGLKTRPAWVREDHHGGCWPARPSCQRWLSAVASRIAQFCVSATQGLSLLTETISSLAPTQMVKEWGHRERRRRGHHRAAPGAG